MGNCIITKDVIIANKPIQNTTKELSNIEKDEKSNKSTKTSNKYYKQSFNKNIIW